MEMPELNEDLLGGESNTETLNPAANSVTLSESEIQSENKVSENVEEVTEKVESSGSQEKGKDDEVEKTLNDEGISKSVDDSNEEISHGELMPASEEEKQNDFEPVRKKVKLEELDNAVCEPEVVEQHLQKPELLSNADQIHSESKSEASGASETQELTEVSKGNHEKVDLTVPKEEKSGSGPDTDMLATLASAALEQDPKDKNSGATATTVTKVEAEIPKKKPEMWCNVGVFDTNTTIVSDYLATPEPNEMVDLVTATLGGRRIQLEPGTAYKFRVCAVNGCGTGPWSDAAAFKTTLPGYPGAPSAIKISKSPEGAHLTWEPPGGNSSEILEYAVYLAVRSASQGCQPVTTNQAQLAFVRVFCGPTNKCMVGTNSLQAAHIDTTTKPAIIFRIAARNSKGYGPATQVRWLQESQNGTSQGVKRAAK